MFEWCLRYSLDAKLFPQASHMNGFSPNMRREKSSFSLLCVDSLVSIVCMLPMLAKNPKSSISDSTGLRMLKFTRGWREKVSSFKKRKEKPGSTA